MNNRKRMIMRVYRKYPILYVYTVIGRDKTHETLLIPDFMNKCLRNSLRELIRPRSIKSISPIRLGRMNGRHDGYNVKFTTIDEVHMNHFERIDFNWDTESVRKATEGLKELGLTANEAAKAFDWSEFSKQLGC